MREINFRVWDEKQEVMFYYDCHSANPLYIKFNGAIICVDNNGEEYTEGNLILMQFIGLKDKNGKKIYEGDIVVTKNCNDKIFVGWSDIHASFNLNKKGWMFEHYFGEAFDGYQCEIIGNIYKNPELLTTTA